MPAVAARIDRPATAPNDGLERLSAWFTAEGRSPFAFQSQTWAAYLEGQSGLVHAPTGSGKTLAVFGGPAAERLAGSHGPGRSTAARRRAATDPLTLLWLTPMRALAADTAHSLTSAARGLDLPWSIELRTSDTSSSVRKRQRDRLPSVLVTTPESLSLLLSYADAPETLRSVRCVVVDEWHELLSTKRGVQAELGLARLRAWSPSMRTWGLSATLGNLTQAADVLVGTGPRVLIHASIDRAVEVATAIPESIERFPWGGHMGLRMLDDVADAILRIPPGAGPGKGDAAGTSLVFTNTRAQAEIWFRALMERRPELLGQLAIHHGSLDRAVRRQVEALLRDGRLRGTVCTSSLDLGVDFAAVDQVIQVGSPKGVGRLMQRAGRSGHRPGLTSRVLCVPTHAFELIEFSAAREAIAARAVEPREPLSRPLDVLVQHLVTVAAGGGFDEDELRREVRTTHAYAELADEEWRWAMDFVVRGGESLTAYPRFARVRRDEVSGRWVIASAALARTHRLSIGTITADAMMSVVTRSGRKLGTIEESFVGKLRPGDRFVFAGRALELVRVYQMSAIVRPAKGRRGTVPQWAGGRFPLSTRLSDGVRRRLDEARRGHYADAEMRKVAPLLQLQQRWSALPAPDELLIECSASREGVHYFFFPFLGRLVHEGLAAIVGHRLGRRRQSPVTASFTDYGIEMLVPVHVDLSETDWLELLSPDRLLDDLLACLNAGELTRRQFREVARVAGLIVVNVPGAPRSARQLQASSELFFDVFCEFDPKNLLLEQARREVLERQLEVKRLTEALAALAAQKLVLRKPKRFTPMAFPVWAQRIQSQTIRVEAAQQRIERMLRKLEAAAGA